MTNDEVHLSRTLTFEPQCTFQDQLSTLARTMKATVTKNNKEDKLKAGQQYLSKLRALAVEVSSTHTLHCLPCLLHDTSRRKPIRTFIPRQYSLWSSLEARSNHKPHSLSLWFLTLHISHHFSLSVCFFVFFSPYFSLV